MSIASVNLETANGNLHVSSGNTAVTVVYITNYSDQNAEFSLWALASGETATNTTLIYNSIPVTAGDTYYLDLEKLIYNDNDALQANANINGRLSATVSYIAV